MQRSKFEAPSSRIAARAREVSLDVGGGFHGGVPSQDVPPGFSPMVQNFVPNGTGHITPRSGLSKYNPSDFSTSGPVLGAFDGVDTVGRFYGVAISTGTVQVLSAAAVGYDWRQLSYVSSILTHQQGRISSNSADYFNSACIYAPNAQENFVVFSSDTIKSLKFLTPSATVATYSDFTWADSIDSTSGARGLCSINDRLVLFGIVTSGGGRLPTRVMWSARGNPQSFAIADGAGAEDLADMRGKAQAIVRWKEYAILFTEVEIWTALPTLDDYAFRFERRIDNMGTPWPRTIATTPNGIVFLGLDKEVYMTDGVSIAPLGPVGGSGPSRVQATLLAEMALPHRAWGMYNSTLRRYELYYSISGSQEGFPTRALFYDFKTQTWWPQTFPYGLSSGAEMLDTTGALVVPSTQSFYANVFDSFGTAFLFTSAKTTDAGTAIDARWRSRGLKNASRKAHLKEVWIDYEVDSASSGSLWIGSARSNSVFTADTALNFATTNDPLFVPTWTTDNAPAFELRLNDGGRPRIASFFATIQDASKF